MKELSIEQKAKAYDEALERMKSWVKGEHPECFTEAQKAAEFIFPELKESEDDRIRKDIIRVLKGEISFTSEKENEKYIAWLEKQGEDEKVDTQNCVNPTNNPEPKFHEGEWVVTSYGKVNQVVTVDEDGDGFTLDDCTYFSGSWCDMYHLWTIQDAKDGDVICCESGWTCIFKELNSDMSFSSYCFMDDTGWFCETGSESHTLDEAFIKAYNGNIYPATKELRNLLFSKMREAGYEWDADKKELRKE